MDQHDSLREIHLESLPNQSAPHRAPHHSHLDNLVSDHKGPVLPSQNAFALQQKRNYSWDQTIGARVRVSQRVREHANTVPANSSVYTTSPKHIHFVNQNVQTPQTNNSALSWNSGPPEPPHSVTSRSTPRSNDAQISSEPSSWASKFQSFNGYKAVPTGHSPLKHNSRPAQMDPQSVDCESTTENRHGLTAQVNQWRAQYPKDPADLVDFPDSNFSPGTRIQTCSTPASAQRNQASASKSDLPDMTTATPHHKRIRPRDDNSWKKHRQPSTGKNLSNTDIDSSSASTGPLHSPTDQIQRIVRGKVQPVSKAGNYSYAADWGHLPFRKGPPDPSLTDTPSLIRSKTRKFVTPINLHTAQADTMAEAINGHGKESRSTGTEVKAPTSPQKRVMQKVFSFVKGKPVPVHPVTSQGQDFISGPLPPGITPSKAAQVLGAASTDSRHILDPSKLNTVPKTPMTPSINGLDLAGTDIHPALRPQFQAKPSAGTRKRSNTFDSSTSLVARGIALTTPSEHSLGNKGSGLAGLGLQYYEENSPPTPPRKDSSYRLPLAQEPGQPRVLDMSSTPKVRIDAARPYPQPSHGLEHTAHSMHGAYEMASPSSLTISEASPRRTSKPASGFSVAASPQLLPGGHLPSCSYNSTPSTSGMGGRMHRDDKSNASTGSPTPKKRVSLLPSPLRQATSQFPRHATTSGPSLSTSMGGQELIHPSFRSESTAESSADGADARLQSLEARYASLEERVTARLAELAGAQNVLVRGVGEWAANCDAVARSTAQVRQGVTGVSLEVSEVLQEVSCLAGGLRGVRESLDLMGRRMRVLERGYGEVRAEKTAFIETMASMQQQLGGIARSVDSISIYIVHNEERSQD